MGHKKAGKLLHLALDIASPTVFMALKGCLQQIRRLHSSEHQLFPDPFYSIHKSLLCWIINENLSTIGMRLCSWKMYQIRKGFGSASMFEDNKNMFGQLSSRIDRGIYWDHWVNHVGYGNESILCLISFTPSRLPCSPQLSATSYRDFPVRECVLVGEIFRELRPQIISVVDTEIFSSILCLKQPQGLYQLEQWSDEYITRQTLSSEIFVDALRRVQ